MHVIPGLQILRHANALLPLPLFGRLLGVNVMRVEALKNQTVAIEEDNNLE